MEPTARKSDLERCYIEIGIWARKQGNHILTAINSLEEENKDFEVLTLLAMIEDPTRQSLIEDLEYVDVIDEEMDKFNQDVEDDGLTVVSLQKKVERTLKERQDLEKQRYIELFSSLKAARNKQPAADVSKSGVHPQFLEPLGLDSESLDAKNLHELPDNETNTFIDVSGADQDAGSAEEDARSVEQDARSVEQDARSVEQDAGSAEEDAGSAEEDAGSAEEDAGSVEQDAGSAEEDAGSVEQDARSIEQDARSVEQEARSIEQDAGSAEEDAGSVEQDAGSAEEDAGCTSVDIDQVGLQS